MLAIGSLIFLHVYDACIILLLHALPILYAGSIIWCPPFLNVEEGDSGFTITYM